MRPTSHDGKYLATSPEGWLLLDFADLFERAIEIRSNSDGITIRLPQDDSVVVPAGIAADAFLAYVGSLNVRVDADPNAPVPAPWGVAEPVHLTDEGLAKAFQKVASESIARSRSYYDRWRCSYCGEICPKDPHHPWRWAFGTTQSGRWEHQHGDMWAPAVIDNLRTASPPQSLNILWKCTCGSTTLFTPSMFVYSEDWRCTGTAMEHYHGYDNSWNAATPAPTPLPTEML
jgi:hypothetical protein